MSKLRRAEWLVGMGGLAIAFGAPLAWYRIPDPTYGRLLKLGSEAVAVTSTFPTNSMNAWDLSWTRWIMYATAFAAFLLFFSTVFARTTAIPTITAPFTAIAGLIATIAVSYRWISPPVAGAETAVGLYLSLGGAIAVLVGAIWSERDEFTPAAFEHSPEPELVPPEQLVKASSPPTAAGESPGT